MADEIRVDYDQLRQVAARFSARANTTQQTHQRVQRSMNHLQGAWAGLGSQAFFTEMTAEVLPALQRLTEALRRAQAVTLQASRIFQAAEEDASQPFRGNGTGSGEDASFPEKTDLLDQDQEGALPTLEERNLVDQLLNLKLPWWLDIGISLAPGGDLIDLAREQVLNRLAGKEPDALITSLAALGLAADLGWLNPFPSAEDAPNAALGALKLLAKQLPQGAARDALAEMIDKAVKNPDELKNLVDLTAALGKHTDLLDELVSNPGVMHAVIEGGPEFVELLAKYGDDGFEAAKLLGRNASEVFSQYDEIAQVPGADNLLRDLRAGGTTTTGAAGEVRYFASIQDEIAEVGSRIDGRKAADGILKDGTVVDVKNYNFANPFYDSPARLDDVIDKMLTQIDLRRLQYPGQPIRYVFTSPISEVPKPIREALTEAGVEIAGMP